MKSVFPLIAEARIAIENPSCRRVLSKLLHLIPVPALKSSDLLVKTLFLEPQDQVNFTISIFMNKN